MNQAHPDALLKIGLGLGTGAFVSAALATLMAFLATPFV